MDAFGDIGGLVEAAFIISTFILSPLYHNIQAIRFYEKVLQYKHKEKYIKMCQH